MTEEHFSLFGKGLIEFSALVRAGRRRDALSRLLFVMERTCEGMDPIDRLGICAAFAALAGDLHDLQRGRPVPWMQPDEPPRDEEGNLPRGQKVAPRDQVIRRCAVGMAMNRWRELRGNVAEGERVIAAAAGCAPSEVRSWRKNLKRDRKTLTGEEAEIVEELRPRLKECGDTAELARVFGYAIRSSALSV